MYEEGWRGCTAEVEWPIGGRFGPMGADAGPVVETSGGCCPYDVKIGSAVLWISGAVPLGDCPCVGCWPVSWCVGALPGSTGRWIIPAGTAWVV